MAASAGPHPAATGGPSTASFPHGKAEKAIGENKKIFEDLWMLEQCSQDMLDGCAFWLFSL